jgi:hypothetical protein
MQNIMLNMHIYLIMYRALEEQPDLKNISMCIIVINICYLLQQRSQIVWHWKSLDIKP